MSIRKTCPAVDPAASIFEAGSQQHDEKRESWEGEGIDAEGDPRKAIDFERHTARGRSGHEAKAMTGSGTEDPMSSKMGRASRTTLDLATRPESNPAYRTVPSAEKESAVMFPRGPAEGKATGSVNGDWSL